MGIAAATATQQQTDVFPESLCEYGVQERIAEGVDRIEENEQDF